ELPGPPPRAVGLMLDLRWIRQSPEEVRERLALRGDAEESGARIDRILASDERRRRLIAEGESLKARRNTVSQEGGERKRAGGDADELIREMRSVSDRIKEIDQALRDTEAEIEDLLLRLPNAPDPAVPPGGEEQNQVVREWGERPDFSFEPRPHWELG